MLALSYMSSSEDKTTTWSISNIREHGEGSETPSPALCCLEATIQWQGGCLFINSCVLSRPFWGGTLSITLGITLKPQYKSLFPPPFWIWVCKKKKGKKKMKIAVKQSKEAPHTAYERPQVEWFWPGHFPAAWVKAEQLLKPWLEYAQISGLSQVERCICQNAHHTA